MAVVTTNIATDDRRIFKVAYVEMNSNKLIPRPIRIPPSNLSSKIIGCEPGEKLICDYAANSDERNIQVTSIVPSSQPRIVIPKKYLSSNRKIINMTEGYLIQRLFHCELNNLKFEDLYEFIGNYISPRETTQFLFIKKS